MLNEISQCKKKKIAGFYLHKNRGMVNSSEQSGMVVGGVKKRKIGNCYSTSVNFNYTR